MAKKKMFKVTVTKNRNYCGICAGGVQFANGEAIIPEGRMVEWYREHDGYDVKAIAVDGDDTKTDDSKNKDTKTDDSKE